VIALCALLVALCLGFSGLAIFGAWLICGRAVQAMRFDLDATQQALKLQSLIDQRVRERTMLVEIDSAGRLVKKERAAAAGEQPPDPNVRTTSMIDDIHEIERESNRVTGEADYDKRDTFQPLPPMEG
jgi:hypothetical protein